MGILKGRKTIGKEKEKTASVCSIAYLGRFCVKNIHGKATTRNTKDRRIIKVSYIERKG